MVDSGQRKIRSVGFSAQLHPDLPVEVIERDALLTRTGDRHFEGAERPEFAVLFVVRSGSGRHVVDFDPARLQPGRLVLVWPGQVQLWDTSTHCDASVVLARPAVLPARAWVAGESAYRDLSGGSMTTAIDLTAALAREQHRFEPTEPSVRLLTGLFASLLALFDRASATSAVSGLPSAYVAFRTAIEAGFTRSRNVRDHVAGLGYSERTVNRACLEVAGKSAKALLDDRVLLEAKRILAHTDQPAATVARRLGFSEATNFHKFFSRHTSQTPSLFRADLRSAGYVVGTASSDAGPSSW